MSGSAFKKTNLYEVNSKKYRPPRTYEYRGAKSSQSLSVSPTIRMQVWNVENGWVRDAYMMVDTGAFLSTLSEATANSLAIDCQPRGGEPPVLLKGAGGNPIIGFLRCVAVRLGGELQKVPVMVPVPVPLEDLYEDGETPLSATPKFDVLGRVGIFENYLLCFNSKRLYAFRRRGC